MARQLVKRTKLGNPQGSGTDSVVRANDYRVALAAEHAQKDRLQAAASSMYGVLLNNIDGSICLASLNAKWVIILSAVSSLSRRLGPNRLPVSKGCEAPRSHSKHEHVWLVGLTSCPAPNLLCDVHPGGPSPDPSWNKDGVCLVAETEPINPPRPFRWAQKRPCARQWRALYLACGTARKRYICGYPQLLAMLLQGTPSVSLHLRHRSSDIKPKPGQRPSTCSRRGINTSVNAVG